MWWCHHIRAEVIPRQLSCHKQLYLMWIWFILLLGLWSPVTSALVRIQVADVLISSVTVPQGQRYDSQRSHSDSTNHVCVGMYQSVCLLCRVGRGGCTTFLILISHSSNHQWWRMSIPGTQEEGAGREREKGGSENGREGLGQVFPSFGWLSITIPKLLPAGIENVHIVISCSRRAITAAVLGIQASRDDIIQPVLIGWFSLEADGDRWARRGLRYKPHLQQVRSEKHSRLLHLTLPCSLRGCPAFRGRGGWRKRRFFSRF